MKKAFPVLAFVALLAACLPLEEEPETRVSLLAPRPREVLSPPQIVADDTFDLVGRDDASVARLLKEPTIKRFEPPAEVWQYVADSCVLFVYFYQEPQGLFVRYVDIRNKGDNSLSVQGCARVIRRGL